VEAWPKALVPGHEVAVVLPRYSETKADGGGDGADDFRRVVRAAFPAIARARYFLNGGCGIFWGRSERYVDADGLYGG